MIEWSDKYRDKQRYCMAYFHNKVMILSLLYGTERSRPFNQGTVYTANNETDVVLNCHFVNIVANAHSRTLRTLNVSKDDSTQAKLD